MSIDEVGMVSKPIWLSWCASTCTHSLHVRHPYPACWQLQRSAARIIKKLPLMKLDIASRVTAEELRPDHTIVSKIMTRNPTSVNSDSLTLQALYRIVQAKSLQEENAGLQQEVLDEMESRLLRFSPLGGTNFWKSTGGFQRQLKYGHFKKLQRAIKLCEHASVSPDPIVTSFGSF